MGIFDKLFGKKRKEDSKDSEMKEVGIMKCPECGFELSIPEDSVIERYCPMCATLVLPGRGEKTIDMRRVDEKISEVPVLEKDNHDIEGKRVLIEKGGRGDEREVETLINALYKQNEHPALCLEIASALYKIKDPRALGALNAFIESFDRASHIVLVDENVMSKHDAELMMSEIRSKLREMFRKPESKAGKIHYFMAKNMWDDVIKEGEQSVEYLIQALGYRGSQYDGAISALVKIGQPAIEPLIQSLKNKNPKIREKAVVILGNIGDKRAIKPLIDILKDDEKEVRAASVKALGNIEDSQVIGSLIEMLSDKESNVWGAATDALCKLGHDAVQPLIKALDGKDKILRIHAAIALGRIGDVQSIESLLSRLDDSDWEMRASAVEALGNIGSVRSVEFLVGKLNDNDWHVRKRTVDALRKIGDIGAIKPLENALNDKDENVRMAAKYALESFRKRKAEGS